MDTSALWVVGRGECSVHCLYNLRTINLRTVNFGSEISPHPLFFSKKVYTWAQYVDLNPEVLWFKPSRRPELIWSAALLFKLIPTPLSPPTGVPWKGSVEHSLKTTGLSTVSRTGHQKIWVPNGPSESCMSLGKLHDFIVSGFLI